MTRPATALLRTFVGGLTVAVAPLLTVTPSAHAEPTCTTSTEGQGVGGSATTVCETPGNAEISSTPPEDPDDYRGAVLPWEGYGPAIM